MAAMCAAIGSLRLSSIAPTRPGSVLVLPNGTGVPRKALTTFSN